MGNISDAVKTNERALTLVQESEVRYRILLGYQRGLLLLVEGKLEEAKKWYETTNDMAEKNLDGIAVEEAIRRLKDVESLLARDKKALGRELLKSLHARQDRLEDHSNQDTRHCMRGYF